MYLHTCYRVLDPERSVRFYVDALGMELQRKMPIREEATNYFLSFPGDTEPRLELTHNPDVTEPYEIGTGYGHIALAVRDLDATLAALKEKGVEPERPPYSVRAGGSRIC